MSYEAKAMRGNAGEKAMSHEAKAMRGNAGEKAMSYEAKAMRGNAGEKSIESVKFENPLKLSSTEVLNIHLNSLMAHGSRLTTVGQACLMALQLTL